MPINKGVTFSFAPNLVFLWKGSKGYKGGEVCTYPLTKGKRKKEERKEKPTSSGLDIPKKSLKNQEKRFKKSGGGLNFFPFFFWWVASYKHILSKHYKHLIKFITFVYAVGYRNSQSYTNRICNRLSILCRGRAA